MFLGDSREPDGPPVVVDGIFICSLQVCNLKSQNLIFPSQLYYLVFHAVLVGFYLFGSLLLAGIQIFQPVHLLLNYFLGLVSVSQVLQILQQTRQFFRNVWF